jgi:hypothetical protein
VKNENELRYFDSLTRIAKAYMTTEQLQRRAQKMYGVSYHEALEMAYDNIQADARNAIRGKRRPKSSGGQRASRSGVIGESAPTEAPQPPEAKCD